MSEWLHHHLARGVDHIHLINDRSVDHWRDIVDPYVKEGVVSLGDAEDIPMRGERQVQILNYKVPLVVDNRFDWVSIIDLDEFLWSPKQLDMGQILKFQGDRNLIRVFMDDFGDNGHITQPDSLVHAFTRRAERPDDIWRLMDGRFKSIVRPELVRKYHFHIPRIHPFELPARGDFEDPLFCLNHYKLQSRERWDNVVTPRGSANLSYAGAERKTARYFEDNSLKMNAVEDLGLVEQNREYGLS